MNAPAQSPGARLWPILAVATAMVLAIALRTLGVGTPGLWVDEAYTALVARLPLPEMMAQLRADEAPPFFYLLQRPFTASESASETSVRFIPLLAGILTVGAAWLAARRWSESAGICAAWIFAASSIAIYYSRQARSYSVLHLLSLALLVIALLYRKRPTGARAGLFLICAAALLFTHNLSIWSVLAGAWVAFGPFPGTSQPADSASRPDGSVSWTARWNERGVRLAALGLAALGLLWFASIWHQLGVHKELNAWMGGWWEGRSLIVGPLYSFGIFSNGGAATLRPPVPIPDLPPGWSGLHWVLWAAVAGAWITLAFRLWSGSRGLRPSEKPSSLRSPILAIVLFTLIPLLGLLITSWSMGPAYVLGRTDTLALPGFLLGTALGWSLWKPRAVAVAVVALWVAAGCATWFPSETSEQKGADRELAQKLGERVQPGDAVYVAALGRPTLEYYARRFGWWTRASSIRSFPPVADRNFAAVPPMPIDSAQAFLEDAMDIRQGLDASTAGDVWVLAPRSGTGSTHDAQPERSAQPEQSAQPAPSAPRNDSPWPHRPSAPPQHRDHISAAELSYPTNLIVYAFAGTKTVPVVWEYRQDGVGADRVALRLVRSEWIHPDSLPGVEVAP